MIEAVLFDMGKVLIEFSHPRMHAQMGEVLGCHATDVAAALMAERLQDRYEGGHVTTAELIAAMRRIARREFDEDALVRASCDIFEPIAATVATAWQLKRAGYRLAVVSNTNEAHVAFIQERYEILAPFDALVMSYAVRAIKPEPAFYAAAVAQVGASSPAACVFIDDVAVNVAGAASYGMTGVLCTTPAALRDELRRLGLRGLHEDA